MLIQPFKTTLRWLAVFCLAAAPVRAAIVSLSVSGTIGSSGSANTIPVGTPWTFEVIYDTAAPDLDVAPPDPPNPVFGRFTNTGSIPALTFFHYKAGTYEVTLDGPEDFDALSEIHITFINGAHAIDLNLFSPLFPPLAGGAVSFHADFNNFTVPVLTSDALPTDTTLDLSDFPVSTVTLNVGNNNGISSGGPDITSFAIAPVPEPSTGFLVIAGLLPAFFRRRAIAPLPGRA